jgi:hypothetical protein
VVRLLEENKVSKQLVQLFRLADLAGYQVEFSQEKEGGVRVERIGNISRQDPVTQPTPLPDPGRCHRRSGQNHSGDARTQRQKFFERIPQGIAETVKEGVVEAGPMWGWIYDTLGEL